MVAALSRRTSKAVTPLWGRLLKRGVRRAFWSGAGIEARALELGFETLGKTRAGQNLIKLTEDMSYYPGSQAYNMWASAAKNVVLNSDIKVKFRK